MLPGVQMSIRSMSGRLITWCQSVSTDCQPNRAATAAAAVASLPQMAVRSGVIGRSKKLGALRQACECAAPMNA